MAGHKPMKKSMGALMPIDPFKVAEFLGLRGPWILLLILFLWVMFMPDKVERVRQMFTHAFSWMGSRVRRGYHTSSIRASLNPQIDRLRDELGIPEELPGVEIRFVAAKNDDRPAFEKGRVVVFLRDPTASRAENVVKAAMHYVGTSVHPQARPYMNEPTNTALDLALARRMLQGDRDALRHYTRYFIDDICSVDPAINRIYSQLSNIDERGLLPGVLLHQLSALSLRLNRSHYHDPAVQSEVADFIRFLGDIATRERSEVGLLDFNVRYIKVKVILLGKDETLDEFGFQPYKKQLARAMMTGFQGAYVLAAGRKAKLVGEFLTSLEGNEYFRTRINDVALEERTVTFAGRRSERAIGYVSFRHTSALPKSQGAGATAPANAANSPTVQVRR